MIEKISLKFGSHLKEECLSFDVTPVTVFVGPNNSGKSRLLAEIESCCTLIHARPENQILANVEFSNVDAATIESEIRSIEQPPHPGERLDQGFVAVGRMSPTHGGILRQVIYKPGIVEFAQNMNRPNSPFGHYLRLFVMKLDGAQRLGLVGSRQAGDLLKTPDNHLSRLFQDDALRAKLRDIVFNALTKYLVIDPTLIGQLRMRLSKRAPVDVHEEKNWDSRAVDFHRDAMDIAETSDGVKAFVGIVTTIVAGDPKITLIDEPEAFLHPALANKLGHAVCANIGKSEKRLFVSTHSPQFLMGCIQAAVPINIVRLTYNGDPPTARLLPQDKLLRLMRNPLLRSIGVLSGLFYDAVIVGESDSDRAFYQEINERLNAIGDSRGIKNCLFLNAQNKQTVWEIVRPLRELGIPAAGIVDIDVLKEGGKVWGKPLEGAYIPRISHPALQALRDSLLTAMNNTTKDIKREGGIGVLQRTDKEAAQNLLDQLTEYGVFVVPRGELESWLPELQVKDHGSAWLIKMFEKMGEDSSEPQYVKPEVGDVWDFIGSVSNWVKNPARKGIPT
jgi:predicted ATPase